MEKSVTLTNLVNSGYIDPNVDLFFMWNKKEYLIKIVKFGELFVFASDEFQLYENTPYAILKSIIKCVDVTNLRKATYLSWSNLYFYNQQIDGNLHTNKETPLKSNLKTIVIQYMFDKLTKYNVVSVEHNRENRKIVKIFVSEMLSSEKEKELCDLLRNDFELTVAQIIIKKSIKHH